MFCFDRGRDNLSKVFFIVFHDSVSRAHFCSLQRFDFQGEVFWDSLQFV